MHDDPLEQVSLSRSIARVYPIIAGCSNHLLLQCNAEEIDSSYIVLPATKTAYNSVEVVRFMEEKVGTRMITASAMQPCDDCLSNRCRIACGVVLLLFEEL